MANLSKSRSIPSPSSHPWSQKLSIRDDAIATAGMLPNGLGVSTKCWLKPAQGLSLALSFRPSASDWIDRQRHKTGPALYFDCGHPSAFCLLTLTFRTVKRLLSGVDSAVDLHSTRHDRLWSKRTSGSCDKDPAPSQRECLSATEPDVRG